jgi:hypothetical protein
MPKCFSNGIRLKKRIGELIDAGRYLSQKEIEHYPVYHAQEEARKARWAISNEFRLSSMTTTTL